MNAKIRDFRIAGRRITTLGLGLPRGSQTFFLPVVADLPGTWEHLRAPGSAAAGSERCERPGG
ncbi:MAG: hypothetical protein IPJ58_06690 [Ardenticatenia bacterium]|nr:hypothetical protein [Ardenticatenia bacterium]